MEDDEADLSDEPELAGLGLRNQERPGPLLDLLGHRLLLWSRPKRRVPE
jgi:hypothetical protein